MALKFVRLSLIAAVALSAAACQVKPDQAAASLSAQGFRNVQMGGHSFTGCSQEDGRRSKFTATAADGSRVAGVICAGHQLFGAKGATVRITRVLTPAPEPSAATELTEACRAYFQWSASSGQSVPAMAAKCSPA